PDPLARLYDFAADPLAFAESRMKLTNLSRAEILDKFVKSGESWAKARRGYEITLGTQVSSVSMLTGWLGGSYIVRDHKGDAGDRKPVEPVPAERQRQALDFVLKNSFFEKSFGLTPDLLARMTVDKFGEEEGGNASAEATFPIHDRIAGIQASVMTRLLNPTTLRRVYDSELAVPSAEDV